MEPASRDGVTATLVQDGKELEMQKSSSAWHDVVWSLVEVCCKSGAGCRGVHGGLLAFRWV